MAWTQRRCVAIQRARRRVYFVVGIMNSAPRANARGPTLRHRLLPRSEADALRTVDMMVAEERRLQPPKLWKATGTGMGTLTPTIPICTRWTKLRAVSRIAGEDCRAVAELVLALTRASASS